jgi:excisionase family DNA binding protein
MWVTITEAAKLLGCSRQNIHKKIERGTIESEIREVTVIRQMVKINNQEKHGKEYKGQ